jgi:hypothetical protein
MAFSTFSEQQLVDCDKIDGGCSGEWYTQTWKNIKLTDGIVRDSKYPYTATVRLKKMILSKNFT